MVSYACGTKSGKTEKSCCEKNKSDKTDKKDCCKNRHSKNNNNNDGCEGKCKDASCSCPTVHFAFNLPCPTEISLKKRFAESKKIKFYDNDPCLSDGFYSIWTPPNIG